MFQDPFKKKNFFKEYFLPHKRIYVYIIFEQRF